MIEEKDRKDGMEDVDLQGTPFVWSLHSGKFVMDYQGNKEPDEEEELDGQEGIDEEGFHFKWFVSAGGHIRKKYVKECGHTDCQECGHEEECEDADDGGDNYGQFYDHNGQFDEELKAAHDGYSRSKELRKNGDGFPSSVNENGNIVDPIEKAWLRWGKQRECP